ncbi:MAG: 3-dehydroquinate dehydratase [Enterobacterales bacterium]|nr:3-dehydroquinate dehydratase [Enterobacterales bacterium]
MATILLLNGPNLNLLGTRETTIYGAVTLESISEQVARLLISQGHQMQAYQSNHEGALIDRIQLARQDGIDFILFNPAGYTHTSVALRDALLGVAIPFIEIHLSEPKQREPFRHHSYFSDIAVDVFSGHGVDSYVLAAKAAINRLNH